MNRMDIDAVRQAAERGENQRQEFKADAQLDGGYKNHICYEIAGMANGGGGRIFIGIDDGATVTGVPRATAETLSQTGYLQKLLTERMEPQPEISAYAVDVEEDRAVVVIDVTAPWDATEPRFMPVVLTQDVQSSSNRLLAAAGSVVLRSYDRCERVRGHRQLDAVMRPLLDRFREAEIKPMLRAMLRQGLLDQRVVTSRLDESDAAFPGLNDRIAALQAVRPAAALYDCRLTLDGVKLTREEQHELIDRSSAPGDGWPVPPYIAHLVRPFENGSLGFEYPVVDVEVPDNLRMIHEFWRLTPDGRLASVLIDRVDMYCRLDGRDLPPPGPERPIDSVSLAKQVLNFLRFAANAASRSGAKSLWISIALDNVLERPVSRVFHPQMPIVDRVGLMARFPASISNRRRVACEREFDSKALVTGWRDVAIDWSREMFASFGWDVPRDDIQQVHDQLLRSR